MTTHEFDFNGPWPDVQDGDLLTVHCDGIALEDSYPLLRLLGKWTPVRDVPPEVLRQFGITYGQA